MISRAIETWSGWPTWAKWASGIGAVVFIDAAIVASGERNFIAAFAEQATAIVLRCGLLALTIAGGVWVGIQVAKRTQSWMGWVAGIAVAIVVSLVGSTLAEQIPGVSWRLKAMADTSCHTDWDGRSNPTACD